ncbi:hypothetical protein [Altererythrobacter lutimaris]|uniref:Glycerophosphoryl diester phosphodiesterase membrane domain-containing protein n=1 Tax=Altererythrobacter lutimaris TaxID=2743979 RepID=A0A850H533_9SPHN|nr:hypothetical protein [Altererythrobacter lutimaris]NVE94314.1 hypothetical protein [Altererythrobacter lutimaris]
MMEREKNFGGFFGSVFDVVGRNITAIAIYTLVVGGINGMGMALGLIEVNDNIGGFNIGATIEQGQSFASVLFTLLGVVVAVVGAYFLLAQFLRTDGRLGTSDTRIWAYIGMTLLSGIGFIFGFLLLVIPGIILLVRWSASSGYLIGKGEGVVDSLRSSWDATRGYSWPIFFAGLVLGLLVSIVVGIFVAAAAYAGGTIVLGFIASLTDAASNAVYYAFGIGVYSVLNDISEETAEVFS